MNQFDKAYFKVMVIEGGYIHDKDDPGGETYRGISRVFNPAWVGWQVIDNYKTRADFPEVLNNDLSLQSLVRYLYKKKYWDPYLGDQLDESIAEEMFDQAVNLGLGKAVENLQKSLNILNRNQRDYADIKADGAFGETTLKTYQVAIRLRGARLLFNVLNCYQSSHYLKLMESNSIKEKYIGWFNRIEIKRN